MRRRKEGDSSPEVSAALMGKWWEHLPHKQMLQLQDFQVTRTSLELCNQKQEGEYGNLGVRIF
jgi:hypothetical protein